jgi:threonine dehydratase
MTPAGGLARSDVRPVRRPTESDLAAARAVVASQLQATPLVRLPSPGEVYAKLDTVQPTGSFKVRGGLAAVSAYADRGMPLVTASAGNHALGVGYAAARLGVPATVVVPRTASPAKLDALRRQGVNLVEHGSGYDEAEAHALEIAEAGAVFVSAYNDPHVIAGQATCASEVGEQLTGEFTILVPVGGGGLLAGVALWSAARPGVRVLGVEAAASRAFSTSVAAGEITAVDVGSTLADGLAGNLEPGAVTVQIAAEHDVSLAAVTEPEIEAAIRYLAHECGLVVEGSGAVGVAALLAGTVPEPAGPVVVLLTGRNIAAPVLHRVLRG